MKQDGIRIYLEYAAVLDLHDLPNNSDLDMDKGSTAADVLRLGGVRDDQLRYVIPVINGAKRRIDTVLQDGDRLSLRLPLGGG